MILNIQRMIAEVIREFQEEQKKEVKAVLVSQFVRQQLDQMEVGLYFDGSIEIYATEDLPDLGFEIISK
tara:strand:- start:736 stop:942 length:207 start_codon:yes stop_codon:yes gene_type:complete